MVTFIVMGVVLCMVGAVGLAFGYFIWRKRSNKVALENKRQAWPVVSDTQNTFLRPLSTAEETSSPRGTWAWPAMQDDVSTHSNHPALGVSIDTTGSPSAVLFPTRTSSVEASPTEASAITAEFLKGLVPFRLRRQDLVSMEIHAVRTAKPPNI